MPLPPPADSIDVSELPDQSPHYVRSVAEMGEEREIVAQEDIYASNGMKLVAKGARIDRSQCERLTMHKLRAPLDFVLATEQQVNGSQLALEASKMFADDPAMLRLAERAGDPHGFRHALGLLSLPPPLSFRMTVMREKRAELFQHSLRTALICYALAVRLGLSELEKEHLLIAALCHDLGEMHTDPAMLAAGHRITALERRYVHVHPVTSYVLLRDLPTLSNGTRLAVLHHHERLDGSGYPNSLTTERIHPLGKLLCVAEIMEPVVRRHDLQRLDVLLRLNQRRLDQTVVGALRELLRADTSWGQTAPLERDAMVQLTRLTDVLAAWENLSGYLDVQAVPEIHFLTERMELLRSLVLQSGINPKNLEELVELANHETEVLSELHATLDELDWQMVDIANEVERRAEKMDDRCQQMVDELVGLLRAR